MVHCQRRCNLGCGEVQVKCGGGAENKMEDVRVCGVALKRTVVQELSLPILLLCVHSRQDGKQET